METQFLARALIVFSVCGAVACSGSVAEVAGLDTDGGPSTTAHGPGPTASTTANGREWRLGSSRSTAALRGAAAIDPNTLASAGTCDAALRYVYTCGIAASNINYGGVCDVFAACESNCILATDCSVFLGTATSDLVQAYATCTTSCYAEGPATCNDASLQRANCGLSVPATWNRDGFCNGMEKCLSNCTAATDCAGLTGAGPGARFLPACERACLQSGLLKAPLTYDAAYCDAYPADSHCPTHAPAHPDRFCLLYPLANECADVKSYCLTYASDPWCAQPTNPSPSSPSPYCDAHPYAHICDSTGTGTSRLCNDYPEASECGGYCTLYSTAPGCNSNAAANFCQYYPSAPECDPNYASRYCEYYPTSPECDANAATRHCDLYPTSPECDSSYPTRYCDLYPTSPECRN